MSRFPAGWDHHHRAYVDSTNAEAARLAQAGAALPFWLTADGQSAGRGRRGRPWVPMAGNFFGSCALSLPPDPAQAALRSFSAALALADTLEDLGVSETDVSLKWPNDVLFRDSKLAGILLESSVIGQHLTLVVGIGVNLAAAPPSDQVEPRGPAPIALRPAGHQFTSAELAPVLAGRFAAWEAVFVEQGFAPIRTAWLARAARLGEEIVARLPGREVRGRFVTVDDSGAVVLDTPTGRQHLPAADIFF